jgi:hypothetical protein
MHRLVSLSSGVDDQQALRRGIGNPQKLTQHAGMSSFARRPENHNDNGAFPDPERALT